MTESPRPLLSPGTPLLQLRADTLQVGGTDGDPGVRVGPLDAAAAHGLRALLRGLDGHRTERSVRAEAVAAGVDEVLVADVLALLRRAGRLHDASAADLLATAPDPADRVRTGLELPAALGAGGPGRWHGRRTSTVVVDGATRVGVPLAALLAASGVGRVHVRDRGAVTAADAVVGGLTAADEGRPRSLAAADAVRRVAPGADLRPVDPGHRADLLVLTRPWSAMDPVTAAGHPGQVPHLVATVRGEVGVVGPLVVPGATSCLRCAESTRAAHDPEWPVAAARLPDTAPGGTGPAPATGSTALCLATAVTALTQVLGHLDGTGEPVTVDATLELRSPDLLPRRRRWPAAAARCRC